MRDKIIAYAGKNGKIMALSFVIGILITIGVGLYTRAYAYRIQKNIANEVIRFHVLANSDTDVDQELKLKVRDGILAEYEMELSESSNIEQTRALLWDNLTQIQETAEKIVEAEGYNYAVSVEMSKDMFPTKAYGDVKLPAGEYEALRVVLGEGQGQNWWCVMFPPLCFVDVTKGEAPEELKAEMKEIFTEEEYRLMTASEEDLPIQVKFKIVEWWQERQDGDAFALIQ